MAKIISINQSRKKPKSLSPPPSAACDHKQVIAYNYYRTVNCSICGAPLDPFDVLVDMLKGYVPPDGNDHKDNLLNKELEKRS
ncbi:MAG: hypothetical protein MUO63_08035 [Desulfobulbaceae bacterium]|nr:hypothetical protein [Desulfobulbaceae bacterium]